MKGSDYIALSAIVVRENGQLNFRQPVARAGERCDYVPVEALPRLLAKGRIRLAPAVNTPAKAKKVSKADG